MGSQMRLNGPLRMWTFIESYYSIRTRECYWDPKLLVHGRDDNGNTLLITVVGLEDLGLMTWLLDKGTDVNARNPAGRTALMEASLWGRVEAVKLLLNRLADQDLKDWHGANALDLAKLDERNSHERYIRSDNERIIERPWWDDQNRRKILEILEPVHSGPVSNKFAESQLDYVFFTRSRSGENTNLVLKSFSTWKAPESGQPPSAPKTVARIIDGITTVDAMSGWSHGGKHTVPGTLTWEVVQFAKNILWQFPIHRHDRRHKVPGNDCEIRGSYYASHAEPQAIVQYLKSMNIHLDACSFERIDEHPHVRDVQIIVSNTICFECLAFISCVNNLARRCAGLHFVAWERYIDDSGIEVARKVPLPLVEAYRRP